MVTQEKRKSKGGVLKNTHLEINISLRSMTSSLYQSRGRNISLLAPYPQQVLRLLYQKQQQFMRTGQKDCHLLHSLQHQCQSCGGLIAKKLLDTVLWFAFDLIYEIVLELNALRKGPQILRNKRTISKLIQLLVFKQIRCFQFPLDGHYSEVQCIAGSCMWYKHRKTGLLVLCLPGQHCCTTSCR